MEVDRLLLMIKWSEASMISYTLSPCATRSTWKITNRNVIHEAQSRALNIPLLNYE